jgi:hypothetical protein
MISVVSTLGERLLNRLVPSITADAISAMPQGCSPSCACTYCTRLGNYHCACINLACHVVPCGEECDMIAPCS